MKPIGKPLYWTLMVLTNYFLLWIFMATIALCSPGFLILNLILLSIYAVAQTHILFSIEVDNSRPLFHRIKPGNIYQRKSTDRYDVNDSSALVPVGSFIVVKRTVKGYIVCRLVDKETQHVSSFPLMIRKKDIIDYKLRTYEQGFYVKDDTLYCGCCPADELAYRLL